MTPERRRWFLSLPPEERAKFRRSYRALRVDYFLWGWCWAQVYESVVSLIKGGDGVAPWALLLVLALNGALAMKMGRDTRINIPKEGEKA